MMHMKTRRLLPVAAVLLLMALIWAALGHRETVWRDLQSSMMTFEGGLERRGDAYGVMNTGPNMTLRAGEYRLEYAIETDAPNTLRLRTDNTVSICPERVTLEQGTCAGSVQFTVYNETDNFEILIDYTSGSFLRVDSLSLVGRNVNDNLMTLELALLIFMAGYGLFLRGKLTWERAALVLVMGFAVMMASAPCFKSSLNLGDDMRFHLERLSNLTNGLRSGQFPVRVGGYMNRSYGAITSVYYPELFLYIPAGMILLGTSIQYAMHLFLIGINLLSAAAMFLCARRIFEDDRVGAIASVLYTLAIYRLTDVYTRSALGEALAMGFLPLLVLWLWEVIRGRRERWPLLALSAAALCQSHIISTAIAACTALAVCLLFAVRIVKEKRLLPLVKAGVCTLLLCAFWLAPIYTYNQQGISTDMLLRLNAYAALSPAQLLLTTLSTSADAVYDTTLSARRLEIGIPLLLGALAALCAVLSTQKRGDKEKTVCLFLLLGTGFAFMTTTLFPWMTVDRLSGGMTGYLQFPWRLLMMVCLFFSLAGGYGLQKLAQARGDAMCFAVLGL